MITDFGCAFAIRNEQRQAIEQSNLFFKYFGRYKNGMLKVIRICVKFQIKKLTIETKVERKSATADGLLFTKY